MSFDYRRNSDYLGDSYFTGTPRNAVLDVIFSDVQSSNGTPGGLHTLVYTAAGNETSFSDPLLIGATVVALSRDGLEYTPVESFSPVTKKEFMVDAVTGTISFHPGLPGMMQGEDSVAQYIAEGESYVPITEPVTLQQAKAWLKVEVDDDDDIITDLITSCRQECEDVSGVSFVARTVTAIVKNQLGDIMLPYGPVNSIISCADVDGADVDHTVTGIGSKRIKYPVCDYLRVQYTAGYAALPEKFIKAIKKHLVWSYHFRGDNDDVEDSPAFKDLKRYRHFT